LRKHQLSGYKFRRQHPIGAFIVDFYCPAKHLVIEIDGDSHEERVAYDQKRTAILNKFRCKVIRFTNQQVHDDVEMVLSEIEKVLKE
jgi:very-short-patch-repair endonuclease